MAIYFVTIAVETDDRFVNPVHWDLEDMARMGFEDENDTVLSVSIAKANIIEPEQDDIEEIQELLKGDPWRQGS